ncbi:hypothetical protein ASL14_00525 [Paenibacillus sp. IHB B 3084]|nr:hypothetical protein ASL14_00525 [Paenibacillus sp. IHB B 3084]
MINSESMKKWNSVLETATVISLLLGWAPKENSKTIGYCGGVTKVSILILNLALLQSIRLNMYFVSSKAMIPSGTFGTIMS